jgi:superfamily II DNA or RNA helicase
MCVGITPYHLRLILVHSIAERNAPFSSFAIRDMKTLYPVQEVHKKALVAAISKYDSGLDASMTGTGKTIIAASIAAEIVNPTLVIAPKSLLPMWRKELKERKVKPLGVINYELLRRGTTKFGKWTCGKWQWTLPKDTFVIFDEVQKCKGVRSQNGRILLAAKQLFTLSLSATAAENPAEMRALGYVLRLHNLLDWWAWAKQRGCCVDWWGNLAYEGGTAALEALHHEIFPEHGHRMTVADLADHFTDTQIITTPLDFGEKVSTLYTEMEKELANLADVMADDSTNPAAAALVATLRARQGVELCKVPLIIEMINDLVAEGRSVVAFLNFNASIEAICERIDSRPVIIRGGQSEAERQLSVDMFTQDKSHVILCNLQAGGLGLSLHDTRGVRPRTAIISPSWSAFDVLQALGRIHRAGGQSDTQQHVLFAAGTIEERVEQVVRTKIRNIEILNDGINETHL